MSKLVPKVDTIGLKVRSFARSVWLTRKMSTQSMVNVLVVMNDSEMSSANRRTLFDAMKTSINQLTGPHKYTIYNVTADDLTRNDGWHLTTALVIGIGGQIADPLLHVDKDSFGGHYVNFGLKDLFINFSSNDTQNPLDFNSDYFKRQINNYLKSDTDLNNGSNNQMHLNDTPNEAKTYLISKESNDSFIDNNRHLFKNLRLIDENRQTDDTNDNRSRDKDGLIDVIVNANYDNILFDTKTYFSNLSTERLGNWLVFTDRTTTTMDLIDRFTGIDGFVAITNEQTRGRGRTQNEWLSPKGCAMFTVQLTIDLNSNIGRKIPFIQHLTSLSVVRAIHAIPGYEALDLVVKWPNDILWRKTKGKISGAIVTTTYGNQSLNVLIGCGINVSNREPSLCLNHIIDDYNAVSTKKLDYLNCEQVIAKTLNQLEILLKLCEEFNGMHTVEDMYTKQWIHSDEVIKLLDNDRECMVRIEGLDNDGYLSVKDLSNGCLLSLQPDGNRFDIMKNLIISRKCN